ncbi:glycosyltransferase family 4 protein [Methylophaga lonarensis]|nr:glycosyltransferase family 4 protein [Methylophaga lonarensis]
MNISPVSLERINVYQKALVGDVLHIHWDEFFFRWNDSNKAAAARDCVLKFKSGGGKIVWTVHNEAPHEIESEQQANEFETNRRFICEQADLIHVHSDYAKQHIAEKYPGTADKLVVIPHPSYLGWYHHQPSPHYNKKKAFLLFGNMRRYKGFETIVDAFNRVAHPERIACLALAGNGANEVSAEFSNGIALVRNGGYVDDDMVPDLFVSADFAVFGFSRILTSGSLMLAMTFSTPPIAPAHDSIKDSLPAELHDLLYVPGDIDDFASVIDYASAMSESQYAEKCRVTREYALKLAPENISRMFERALIDHKLV